LEEMADGSSIGTSELLILLALMRLGDDAYGVPIAREIEETSGRAIALASVYATLDRLEDKGFVVSELGEPTAERGGRAKKYFTITGKGVSEVRAAKRSLTKLWKGLPQLGGV
jgi:PadR family transcriptional regulator, regulatory protein PadR